MSVKFTKNAYFFSIIKDETLKNHQTIHDFAKTNQNFHYGKVTFKDYEAHYVEKGWFARKIIALPAALWTFVIKTIWHLCKAIFVGLPAAFEGRYGELKANIYSIPRDLQEGLGRLFTIFDDAFGTYYIQESLFQKKCYRKFVEPDPLVIIKTHLKKVNACHSKYLKHHVWVSESARKISLRQFTETLENYRSQLIEKYDMKKQIELIESKQNSTIIEIINQLSDEDQNELTLEDLILPFEKSKIKFACLDDEKLGKLTIGHLKNINEDQRSYIESRLQRFSIVEHENSNRVPADQQKLCLKDLVSLLPQEINQKRALLLPIAYSFFSSKQITGLTISDLSKEQLNAIFNKPNDEKLVRLALFKKADIETLVRQKKLLGLPHKIFTKDQLHKLQDILTVDSKTINIDPKTSIIYNPNTGQYNYITEAPPIKNLVISGGGAKGVILPGVMKASESYRIGDNTFREQLENIAGSSVGALTAGLIASGMPADEFIQALAAEDFIKVLGKGSVGPLFKSGKPLVKFLRTHIKKTVGENILRLTNKTKLEDIQNVKQFVIQKLHSLGKVYSTAKVSKITKDIEETLVILKSEKIDEFKLTFSMLNSLREVDPKTFKNLTVTATCTESGSTFYFDAEKTPNLDIAIACRASASLPLILDRVKIDSASLLPGYVSTGAKTLTFIDGGWLDNVPVKAMLNKQALVDNKGDRGQNLQTLALVFDEIGTSKFGQSPYLQAKIKKYVLFDPTKLSNRLLRDTVPKVICKMDTKARNTKNKMKNMEEIRKKYTQRNIPLHVDIKTTDFEKAKLREEEFRERGYDQTMEYLANHDNELMYRQFESLKSLLNQIPECKIQSLLSKLIDNVDLTASTCVA